MCIDQIVMEKKQEGDAMDDHLSDSSTPIQRNLPCAWCLSEQGLDLGVGSHGICARHASWILRQYKERKSRRHPR
jgi:hypothetical protein